MFVADEGEHLCRVGAAYETEWTRIQGARNAVDHRHRVVRAQGFFEEVACIAQAAGEGRIGGQHQLLKLGQRRILIDRLDLVQLRNRERKPFFLVVVEMLEQPCRQIGAEENEEYCCFLLPGEVIPGYDVQRLAAPRRPHSALRLPSRRAKRRQVTEYSVYVRSRPGQPPPLAARAIRRLLPAGALFARTRRRDGDRAAVEVGLIESFRGRGCFRGRAHLHEPKPA